MNVTSLALATDLMILRLRHSVIEDHGDHLVVRTPDNPTFWWGNFLALPTPPAADDVPAWLAVFARHFPDATHCAVAVERVGPEQSAGWVEPWQRHGLDYEPGTALVTEALHEPPRPNRHADYRPLGSEDDWAQLVELRCANNSTEEAASYRRFAVSSVAAYRRLVDEGHGQWFGAFLDGRLASTMGLFTDGSQVARYQSVDTHPQARRQGLAGSLAHAVGTWALNELGVRQLVIVADPRAEAISVYRSIGFVDTEPAHQLQARGAPSLDLG
jgi:GNAT superfamily N-acetyltransferase